MNLVNIKPSEVRQLYRDKYCIILLIKRIYNSQTHRNRQNLLGLGKFFFLSFFAISWAASMAYGDSQARGQIGAVATSLHHSHSNTRSELHLQPAPQLMAMPDP